MEFDLSRNAYGEDRFVYEKECRCLFEKSKSEIRKLIINGHFPPKTIDEGGGYGWLASDLADYARKTTFTQIMILFPDKYPLSDWGCTDPSDERDKFH